MRAGAVAVVAVGLSLAACGGGSSTSAKKATPTSTTPTTTTVPPTTTVPAPTTTTAADAMTAWVPQSGIQSALLELGTAIQINSPTRCADFGTPVDKLDAALPSPNAELNTALAAMDGHLRAVAAACVAGMAIVATSPQGFLDAIDTQAAELKAADLYLAQVVAIVRPYF